MSADQTGPRDFKAFEVLLREHHRTGLAYALTLTRSRDQAQDLAQEAFLTAYRKLDSFDASRDFGAWVRGIVKMKHFDLLRASGRQARLSEDLQHGIDQQFAGWQLGARVAGEEVLTTLNDCLGRLQEGLQRAVRRFYLDRIGCAEIAVELATTDIVIRKRLQRARALLHGCLEQKLGPLRGSSSTS